MTDASGNVEEDIDYFPYGGIASGTASDHYLFNGKERDTESGLDNFGARFDASTLGRFMTPDWAEKPTAVPYAHYGNPQSLNLYSYVQNNPTTLGDPDGHQDCSGVNNWLACHAPQVAAAIDDAEQAWSGTVGKLGAATDQVKKNIKKAEQALDAFNGTVGFARSNCADGGDCTNALGMAGTAVLVAIDSGGESEEANSAKILKEAAPAIDFARNELLSMAKDPALRDAISELFRPAAQIGDGSSMAAYREEVQTGAKVGGKQHWKKLIDRRRQLIKAYRSGRLNATDRAIAKGILISIQDALSTRPPI